MMLNVVLNPVLTKASMTGSGKKGLSFSFCTDDNVNLDDLVEIEVNNKVFSFKVYAMEISGSHLLCRCREYGYFATFISFLYVEMGITLFDIQHRNVSLIRDKNKIKKLDESSSWT